jgi:tetratricopeptide (TPR) repeat protein
MSTTFSSVAEIIMASAGRFALEPFRPAAQSLDWQLGQLYWRRSGSRAFLSHEVPYTINNDGNLSVRAAEVLFHSLAGRDHKGAVTVLELGAGVGLFAAYFLDHFAAICADRGAPYYERLRYIIADHSALMLADLETSGVLSRHSGRVETRVMDALEPSMPERSLDAVFCNYVLDCLPFAVLRLEQGDVRQLHLRATLGRGIPLHEFTELPADELAVRAASGDPEVLEELTELHPLLQVDCAYLPFDLATLPYSQFALERVAADTPVIHNYGAIQCVERLLPLLAEGGFVLVNDYPSPDAAKAQQSSNFGVYQRFGASTAMGLNFALLDAFFGDREDCTWIVPDGENIYISSRLAASSIAPQAADAFRSSFGGSSWNELYGPIQSARSLILEGRVESALAEYRRALTVQPQSWVLLGETAKLLTGAIGDHAGAESLATAALSLNPLSSDLWKTLGECLYAMGRMDEAHQALLKALERHPGNIGAMLSLVQVFLINDDEAAALRMIAEALLFDKTGQYREQILKAQSSILERIDTRQARVASVQADRFVRS